MAIDFKTFAKVVGPIADARFPILIRGRHGVGKSETVYQYAKSVGKRVVERRASQMTEGDLVGLPELNNGRTSWNPPDWFKDACENGVVLFMDEIDRAVQEVRQGFFQLTDSRTINGHRLHPDTLIFAAVNGGTHGAQYAVGDMDPAELDRWTVFDVEPTVEDWLDFGKADNRINAIILDFIRENTTHLEHKGEFEPNKKYPSRRSWVRLNDTVGSKLDRNDMEATKARIHDVYQIATGFVGFEAAVSLKDFVEKYERQVTIDDILVNGKLELVDGFKLNDHITLVDKLLDSGRLVATLPVNQLENLARYIMKTPSEAAMKYYTSCTKGKVDVKFVLAMHKLSVDGRSFRDFITGLLDAKSKKK
jgi:MoxR-like ATPase